jgi:hypothetical protein
MDEGLKKRVRDRYAETARSALGEAEDSGSCCGGGASCCGVEESGERAALEVYMACGSYSEAERGELPQLAADASLRCGNPVALAMLSPGEVLVGMRLRGTGEGRVRGAALAGRLRGGRGGVTRMYPPEQIGARAARQVELLLTRPGGCGSTPNRDRGPSRG